MAALQWIRYLFVAGSVRFFLIAGSYFSVPIRHSIIHSADNVALPPSGLIHLQRSSCSDPSCTASQITMLRACSSVPTLPKTNMPSNPPSPCDFLLLSSATVSFRFPTRIPVLRLPQIFNGLHCKHSHS
eukprot:Gb_31231 [translate_table: standard]